MLLAFDLEQPWTCHQAYKLFAELHADIFARREVNVHRILALHDAYEAVKNSLDGLEYRLMAQYRLTGFFMLYLLRQVLKNDETGRTFCQDPESFLDQPNGRLRIKHCMARVLGDLIIDLNAEINERYQVNGIYIDYKRELKNQVAVRSLERNITPPFLKAVARGRALSFGKEWEDSATAVI